MFSQELMALRARLNEVETLRRNLIESISALERAQAQFHKTEPGTAAPIDLSGDGKVSQRAVIRDAIAVMNGEFTSREITQYLHDFHPTVHASLKQDVLSNVLYKFAREGVIKQVRQGTRGRPSAFVRLADGATTDNGQPAADLVQNGETLRA